jgi:hypothetical protein
MKFTVVRVRRMTVLVASNQKGALTGPLRYAG